MKNNKKITWDFKPLTKVSFSKQRSIVKKVHEDFIAKWQKNQKWKSDVKVLKTALQEYENIQRYFAAGAEERYYYSLLTSVDEGSSKNKAEYNKIREFSVDLSNKIMFFEHELAKLPVERKIKFLRAKELNNYRFFLERCFIQGKYLLTDAEEKILNLKDGVSRDNWIKMTSEFLSSSTAVIANEKGKNETKTFSEISSLLYSRNKKVRDQAALELNLILKRYIKVGEAEMNSFLANKKINDELRGLKRYDEMRLVEDCVEPEVVDSMLAVVSANNKIAHRYYKLKAKLLKVSKIKYHERGVLEDDLKKNFSYNLSCDLLKKILNELNPKYATIFNRFVDRGQIDVYPKKGKRGGAFCASGLLSMPTYILLNHTNKLNDVLTIAHEVGHGINNELMRETQNALNFDLSLATAEVASTFFEDFVLKELLKQANDEERFAILMTKLNQDVSTIFRQAALYKFEIELNKLFRIKGFLSHQEIGELFKKHMETYMGKYVEQSPGAENWWLHWPHIRYEFYVYSYVSGLLISKHMQKQVALDKKFIAKVDYFLSAGLSEKPSQVFANIGINIKDKNFWQVGINEISDLLLEAEVLAKKLKKV